MNRLLLKKEIWKKVQQLRIEASKAEKEQELELNKNFGLTKKTKFAVDAAKEIIANKQYWNGYEDALNNVQNAIASVNPNK